jgi:hypothetical protein
VRCDVEDALAVCVLRQRDRYIRDRHDEPFSESNGGSGFPQPKTWDSKALPVNNWEISYSSNKKLEALMGTTRRYFWT